MEDQHETEYLDQTITVPLKIFCSVQNMCIDTYLDMGHLQPKSVVSPQEIFNTDHGAGFDKEGSL